MVVNSICTRRRITKRIEVFHLGGASQGLPGNHVDINHIAAKPKRYVGIIRHVYSELKLLGRFQINDVHLELLASKVPFQLKWITRCLWLDLSQKFLIS